MRYDVNKTFNMLDNCTGVVTSRCGNGVYIQLANGYQAFSYEGANLLPGTQVLVSILRDSRKKGKRIEVEIDSVYENLIFARHS